MHCTHHDCVLQDKAHVIMMFVTYLYINDHGILVHILPLARRRVEELVSACVNQLDAT